MPILNAARRLRGPAALATVSLSALVALNAAAFAQGTPAPTGGGGLDILTSLMPILLLIVIFWLLIFRPSRSG